MRWISVKERLPDEEFLWLAVWVQVRGIEYWCEAEYSPGEEFRGQFCGYDSETGEYYPLDGVTHWMEIEPPMKSNGNKSRGC